MNVVAKKSRWKLYLGLAGLVIMAFSLAYTNFLVEKLKESERTNVEFFIMAAETLQKSPTNANLDFTFPIEVIKRLKNIPIIMVDETGRRLEGMNFSPELDSNQVFLRKELQKLIDAGNAPLPGFGGYADKIYYKQTRLITLLSYFPLIQTLLFMAFISIGYVGFSSARKEEQNRVWVGMAKETAHQLGTPISAIIAWIEHLKQMHQEDGGTHEVLGELNKDVNRLNLIAERFSKIGSEPELTRTNLVEKIRHSCAYMKRRAPRKIQFVYPDETHPPIYAHINAHLFEWVIENLLRNALDSMSREGTIRISFAEKTNHIEVLISDTGSGIPSGKFKKVFEPGYSTKKRGWGLGLSLAKRIIESYHKGKIFVKNSEIEKGSTFAIQLPRAS